MVFKNIFSVLFVLLVAFLPACKDNSKKVVVTAHTGKQASNRSSDYVRVPLEGKAAGNEDQDDESDLEALFEEEESQVVAFDDAAVVGLDADWADIENVKSLKTVYFDFDKDNIRKDQAETISYDVSIINEQLAQLAQDGKKAELLVEGHTCEKGTDKHNHVLSLNRAKTVEKKLVELGITSPIKVVGRGSAVPTLVDGQPLTGKDRDALAPNRRVEIRVIAG